MKKGFVKGVISTLLAASMTAALLAGCGQKDSGDNNGQETTGESTSSTQVAEAGTALQKINPDDTAAKIGDKEVPASEVFYVYYIMKQGMEASGVTDWGTELYSGFSYADYLKQLVENQVITFEYLDSMVDKYKVSLTDEEEEGADSEIKTFLDSVSDEEKEAYGFNEDTIRQMYDKTYLTNKVYAAVEEEAKDSLTEDELKDCKYKKVQHILISTMQETTADSEETKEGETADTEDEAAYKAEKKKEAEEVLKKAQSGEDFEKLAEEYTDDSGVTYYLNEKGQTPDGSQMVEPFYKAVNELKAGEISGIVETEYGYHIIKCINEDDKDAAESAKEQLVTSKIQEGYTNWLAENDVEFTDLWKNYVVVNPQVKEDSSESETKADPEAESETESESKAAADSETNAE